MKYTVHLSNVSAYNRPMQASAKWRFEMGNRPYLVVRLALLLAQC